MWTALLQCLKAKVSHRPFHLFDSGGCQAYSPVVVDNFKLLKLIKLKKSKLSIRIAILSTYCNAF